MSLFQSYRLLKDGEPQEEDDLALEEIESTKHHKRFAEWSQYPTTLRKYGQCRADAFVARLPKRLRPYCSLRPWVSRFAVLLIVVLVLFFLAANAFGSIYASDDVLQYIDPLIGTGHGGHVFAGPSLPFAMSKPVADVSGENMGGFASDRSNIQGFSHLHDSGTGGSPSMGNFPIFLQPDCANISACQMRKGSRDTPYLAESVSAKVGYFAIDLQSGYRAEIAASERAALYKFSFTNATNLNPVILADGSDLVGTFGTRSLHVNPETGRFTAEGEFQPSFGQGTYWVYMCTDFKGARIQDVGSFNRTSVMPGVVTPNSPNSFYASDIGVYTRFRDVKAKDQILARVGMSWLNIERACQNAEREIQDWNFDRLVRDCEDAWRKKLSPITLDSAGVDKSHLRNFWSGVYRAFLSPQDYTGENPLWNSTEPYYDSWYCIWDTFRGVHPFYMLVDTVSQSRMVRSLIDIYKHSGWLPDCRMSFCKGYTQGGSNADVIIVDSYLKGLDGVNWDDAYSAIVKDAEIQPKNWDIEGRGGLHSWKTLGYIPYRDTDTGGMKTRSVSRTFEYAYNDFCIAEMAKATGRDKDADKYVERAHNWRNLIDWDLESMGFKGFPQPRLENKTFVFQNATLCSNLNDFDGCYLSPGGHETYEGSPWLYLFYVPHDMAGLVKSLGGRQSYLDRLNQLHNSGVLYMGDEQAFLTAFLYHYGGRPGLSAKETHRYIPSMFNDTIPGIPGNDDSGSMGTFVFFSMLGIFPNAGQSVYFIIPPFFPSVSIRNQQTGKTATIRNVNFDPTYKKVYIQSAKLNGRTYTKNWIDHSFFLTGGMLELVLGDEESEWGTKDEDLPPSLSNGLYLGR